MKRMALIISLIAVTLSTVLYAVGVSAIFVFTAVLLLSALCCICLKRKLKNYLSAATVLLICALYGLYLILFNHFTVVQTTKLAGKSGNITCHVTEEPQPHGDMTALYVKTSSDQNKNSGLCRSIKLQLWISSDNALAIASVGDIFTADVEFNEIDAPYRKNGYAQGIYVGAYAKNFETVGHKFSFYEWAVNIRQAVREVINQRFTGDKRGILNGVVLGGTSQMSDSLYNDFIKCGVIHITSVSGMHISIICMAVTTLLQLFMNRRRANIVAVIPIIGVIAVTGFHASALRAGFMCILVFVGDALLKRTDGLNSLGLAVTIMLFINPFYVCDLGFGLSCTATAGVIVATHLYNDKIQSRVTVKYPKVNHVVHVAGSVFFQSVGAVIFTLPLQVLEFGFVSLVAPIAGVAICAAVSYTLILAVMGIVLHFIPFLSVLSNLVFAPVWLLLEYVETVIPKIADIPFSYTQFGSLAVVVWMGLSVMLVGVWFLLGCIGGKRLLALLLVLMLAVSLWSYALVTRDVVEISSINLGKGYAVVIYYGEKCVIIGNGDDKGDAYTILSELRLRGVTTVDAILLPSESENCNGGERYLRELLKFTQIATVPTEEFTKELRDGVTLTAVPHEMGCCYLVSVFGTDVLIGFGSYKAYDLSPDILFTGRALPTVQAPKITVVSGDWLPKSAESKYGRVYYMASSSVSVKFCKGKEFEIYAR